MILTEDFVKERLGRRGAPYTAAEPFFAGAGRFFSQRSRSGEAMNMDEYVPTSIPAKRAREKS